MKLSKEDQIVKLLKAKDQSGMKLLLKYYKPLMYYIITPILSNPHDRDECISEITLRLWEKIHLYDETKSNFLTWFTAFVKNTAVNLAKKNAKHGDFEDIKEIKDSIPSNTLTPEQIVLQKEREEELLKALNTLKPYDKLIFYRKYYYMQSTKQIAMELGTTIRAIEGRIYRIKKQLRKHLGGGFYER